MEAAFEGEGEIVQSRIIRQLRLAAAVGGRPADDRIIGGHAIVVGIVDVAQACVGVELRTGRKCAARIPGRDRVITEFLPPQIETTDELPVPGEKSHPGREAGLGAIDVRVPKYMFVHHSSVQGVRLRRRTMVRCVEIFGLPRYVGLVAFDCVGCCRATSAPAGLRHIERYVACERAVIRFELRGRRDPIERNRGRCEIRRRERRCAPRGGGRQGRTVLSAECFAVILDGRPIDRP